MTTAELIPSGPCTAQLTAIHRITSALFARIEVDEMLRRTLDVSMQTTDAEAGSILLHDDARQCLVFNYVVGPVADRLMGETVSLRSSGKCATVFRTGATDISEEGFDVAFDAKSTYKTRSAMTTAIRNFGGQPIGVIQVLNKRSAPFDARDKELLEIVSALAATVIENARRAEVEKQAALARILTYIGHDLKNQVYIVQGAQEAFVPMIEEGIRALPKSIPEAEQLAADFTEFKTMISDAALKASRLALVINEYGARRDLFQFEPNDLHSVLHDELGQLVALGRRYNREVDVSGIVPLPAFPFDPFFVGRAVWNLVNNAFQAIREGGSVRVRTEAKADGQFPDGGYAEITVADNGPGMTVDKLASILEGQAKSDKVGGSGVGTRLVRDVALTHSGLFLGSSEPGVGTTFRLRLPLSR